MVHHPFRRCFKFLLITRMSMSGETLSWVTSPGNEGQWASATCLIPSTTSLSPRRPSTGEQKDTLQESKIKANVAAAGRSVPYVLPSTNVSILQSAEARYFLLALLCDWRRHIIITETCTNIINTNTKQIQDFLYINIRWTGPIDSIGVLKLLVLWSPWRDWP